MTEQEMRELDAWILLNIGWTEVEWKEAGGDRGLHWPSGFYGNGPEGKSYSQGGFCLDPLALAEIKREISRRGWRWESSYLGTRIADSGLFDKPYSFAVLIDSGQVSCEVAETEELAGCLAFREAIEKKSDMRIFALPVQPIAQCGEESEGDRAQRILSLVYQLEAEGIRQGGFRVGTGFGYLVPETVCWHGERVNYKETRSGLMSAYFRAIGDIKPR